MYGFLSAGVTQKPASLPVKEALYQCKIPSTMLKVWLMEPVGITSKGIYATPELVATDAPF
jgi:hypothetical protein